MGIKNIKITNKVDVGNYTYKLPPEDMKDIREADNPDLEYKYRKYLLYQSSKGIDHGISREDFEKINSKSKNSSKDSLKKYANSILKERLLDELSVFINYCFENKRVYKFVNAFEPSRIIKYEFCKENDHMVRITEITDLKNLQKFNKDFKLDIDKEVPFLVFVDICLDIYYYPDQNEIFPYCRYAAFDNTQAANIIYEDRGCKYILK